MGKNLIYSYEFKRLLSAISPLIKTKPFPKWVRRDAEEYSVNEQVS